MTNYFSRLARTTGLHFGAAPATEAAASSAARAPLVAAVGQPPPPPLEEWTFVESGPATAASPEAHDGPAQANAPAEAPAVGQPSVREESHAGARVLPPAEPSVFVDERPAPGERAADSRPPAFFEESRVELVSREEEHASRVAAPRELTGALDGEPPARVAPSLGRAAGEQESSSSPARPMEEMALDAARGDVGRELLETLEVAEAPPPPEVPALPARAEPAASPAARADSRRAYLREVVEWITSPADAALEADIHGAIEPESSAPPQAKTSQPASVLLQRERVEAAHELEVQDFSLSIGSISIVVEDAPRPAPAPAPAPRPEPEQRQPAPVETSRLRRRYIRGL